MKKEVISERGVERISLMFVFTSDSAGSTQMFFRQITQRSSRSAGRRLGGVADGKDCHGAA